MNEKAPKYTEHVYHFMMTEDMLQSVRAYRLEHGIQHISDTLRELIQRGLNCPANQKEVNEL